MWLYNDKVVSSIEDMPEGSIGFIYRVTHVKSGKKYIGKKALYHNRTLPPLKGMKRKRKVVKESDWQTYYGSQGQIKQLVKESQDPLDFTREIITFGYTKKQLTYLEMKQLCVDEVLEREDYFNDNILGKFYRKDLIIDESTTS